ncbi:prepilin-type N-terminal cleavage/methylation domain-containing protein [Rheinheimera marina]|uniref:Prepilin-type N-terminal cleavage/methylation domain-containing protein n=1 Tax=Rheinheimera marina TaxID=1774958 RepID=A0ABV9JMQ2_9GAMM
MPCSSGFTLIELLISLTLAAVLALGSLLALLTARQQVMLAAQYTQASAALADLATLYADSVAAGRDWQPASQAMGPCADEGCGASAAVQQAVQQRFDPNQLPLLPDPQLCLRPTGLQLSWRSQLKLARSTDLCPLAPMRLSTSLTSTR